MSEADWRRSAWKRFEAAGISVLGYRAVAALGATLSWRTEGLEHLDQVKARGRQPIMAFWHGRILPATYYFRRRGIVVITSENFDGEWIAGIIERFGYGTARGSTSRGGLKALLQLTREMEAGKAAGFTVDGPRGPARTAQPGAVWLAKATGNPVVPFHLEANRHWTLRSWDRTQIPKPFATVGLSMGEPFHVAGDADESGLEGARSLLEQRLYALEESARRLVGA
jgi:lysophospholipid acyltransferase (LPLAT)-like uncharacterized protein